MADKSKWFVYKREDGKEIGCFRIKPFNNPECDKALKILSLRSNYLGESSIKSARTFIKIIAKHVIQDWENIHLTFTDKQNLEATKYTPENAYQLMLGGDIGMDVAAWIVEKSKSIQA